MKIWEVIRNLEEMSFCIRDLENNISEIRLHKAWDEEYQRPIKKINLCIRLDTLIETAKQLKEML